MTANTMPSESTADREIVISRVFDAPRELVWAAMTDPKQVVKWWGPHGFTTTIEEMDVRPGGTWKHVMRGPDGVNYPNHSVFQDVVKPERIVYSHGGYREGGPGVNFVATWSFEEVAGKTKLTLRQVFPSAAERDFVAQEFGAIEGGKQTLARLAEHLAPVTERAFVIARVFNAPRALVWRAWTECDRLAAWFGPSGFTLSEAKLDLRPGGKFHYCMESADGHQMWGRFVFREIVPPERLVWVNSFSDKAGGLTRPPFSDPWPSEMLNTVTFAEHAGQTTVTVNSIALNATEAEQQTFDANHASMNQGWTGTLDRLATHLAGIRS